MDERVKTLWGYVVNTFQEDGEPVQLVGETDAFDEQEVIDKCKQQGIVHMGYEFLILEPRME